MSNVSSLFHGQRGYGSTTISLVEALHARTLSQIATFLAMILRMSYVERDDNKTNKGQGKSSKSLHFSILPQHLVADYD